MSVGLIVVLIVLGLIISNFMGAMPKKSEVRLDNFRMTARRLHLMPKLAKAPSWSKSSPDLSADKLPPLLAHYTCLDDTLALPLAKYRASDGVWRYVDTDAYANDQSANSALKHPKNQHKFSKKIQILNNMPIPQPFTDYATALVIQANSIVFIWQDSKFVKHISTAHYDKSPDKLSDEAYLQQLITHLQACLDKITGID